MSALRLYIGVGGGVGGQLCSARVAGAMRDVALSLFILFKRSKLFSSKLKFETNCRLRAKRPPWRKEPWH